MGTSPPLLTLVEAPIYIIQYTPTEFEQRGRDGKVASSTDTGRSTHYTLYNMLPQDLSRGRGMGEVAFSCHTEGEGRERKGRGAKQIYSMKKALLHVSFLRS